MVNITNENNSVVFYIDDEQVLSFPLNELSVLTEEVSDIVMFKTAKKFKTIVQERWEDIRINGEAITKENVIDKFNEIANTNEGGSSEPKVWSALNNEDFYNNAKIGDIIKLNFPLTKLIIQDIRNGNGNQGTSGRNKTYTCSYYIDSYTKGNEKVTAYEFIVLESDYSVTTVEIKLATQNDLTKKQDTLVSGTNIKTINGQEILGEGNIEIQGSGGGITDAPSDGKKYVRQNANWVEETTVDTSSFVTDSELDSKGYKKIEYLTQTQYDELPNKEEGVMYVITDAPEVVIPDISTLATKEEISDMLTKTEASTTYALQSALQAALDRITALEAQVGNISTQLDNINGEVIN